VRQGDQWPVTVAVDGEPRQGWMQLRRCPDPDQTVMLTWLAKAAPTEQGQAVLQGARCLRSDEREPTWPPLPKGQPDAR
jgi:hypothetical protein